MTQFCDRYTVAEHQNSCKLKGRCNLGKCNEFCHRCYTFNYLMENSNIGAVYLKGVKMKPDKVDLDAFRRLKLIKENILEWTRTGESLVIMSGVCGNGKTTWATKLMLNYFAEASNIGFGVDGVFVSVSDLLSQYKNSIGSNDTNILELEKRLINANLVVFDDIGTSLYSNFDIEKLFKILNERTNKGLANIFTTNMTLEILKENMGNRLYSRVVEKSELLEFRGRDRRGSGEIWQPKGGK